MKFTQSHGKHSTVKAQIITLVFTRLSFINFVSRRCHKQKPLEQTILNLTKAGVFIIVYETLICQ